MQKVVATVLVILALACAQSIPSRTTITPINGTVTGLITNVLNDGNALAPVLYSLWVPENAAAIQFNILNTNNDDCTYIDLFLLSYGAPCVDDTFDIDGDAFCLMRTYDYSGSYNDETFVTPGYQYDYFVARTGQYVYIGVSTESTYTGEACTYSFNAVVNTTCGAGQIATVGTSSDEWFCNDVIRGTANNFTYTANNVSTTDYLQEFYFPISQGTGYITFNIESTEDLYVYGASNYGAGENRYDCYDSTSSNGNGNYSVTFTCVYPESGFFTLNVITYFPSDDFFTYTVSSSVSVCNSTTGGYNCTWPAYPLDLANLQTINVGVPYSSGSIDVYTYFYIDVPANYTLANAIQVNTLLGNTTGTENAYVVWSKNSYPDSDQYIDSDQYTYLSIGDTQSWVLSFHDFVESNRIYMGVYCYDGTVCNITITFTPVGVVTTTTTTTTTGTATTGTATTVSGTTVSSTSTATTVSGSTTLTTQGLTTQSFTTGVTGSFTTQSVSNVSVTTSSACGLVASFVVLMVAALF